MYFIDKRAAVICRELKRLRVRDRQPVWDWQYKRGLYFTPAEADSAPEAWEPFDSRTMHWYGPDAHCWFRGDIEVPEALRDGPLWLYVRTQIDEQEDGKNPQFLLFVNGEVVQGIDMFHREVKLPAGAVRDGRLHLDLQAYTGTVHTEFRFLADLFRLDEPVHELYYDLYVPLSAFGRMDPDSKTRLDLTTVLNGAVNLLDLRDPYSEAFYASVEAARAYLEKHLYQEMGGWDEIVATCIGHTHIDVAWLWTVAQTREKTARSFSTVLKLMEEYPNYKFMSSQPVLYEFLRERYPEVYEKLKERFREGRWEAEGGMWLEADCNLTSGESLVRQFLYGKRFFREEFGVDSRILWLPDVFGYSGALPQIMRKCGIDYFMTTKLSWNQFNKIPNDTLLWRGIDGSEVLTHFITTQNVGQSPERFYTTYTGRLHPDAILGGWQRYQNKDINNDILIAYGHGDGGGGPTREMLEFSCRMERGIKGIPKVRQAFARTYFDELKERVSGDPRLETWEGEFYFEYHRGTLTSMARNKRGNRKSELLLMDLELLSVLTRDRAAYPAEALERLWKVVLLNQFHDILPGSAIREAYEVSKAEYEALAVEAGALLKERLALLAGEGDGVTVVNTLGFERSDTVFLPGLRVQALRDSEGRIFPAQAVEGGSVAWVEDIPSKGYRTLQEAEAPAAPSPFRREDPYHLETPFYRVELDGAGHIVSLFDKEQEREVVQPGRAANLLRMFEDKPMNWDNWDIDIYHTEKSWPVDGLVSMEWIEDGPVRASLRLEYAVSRSRIRQTVRFYAKSRRIDFETWVDWKEDQHLLKVEFPVAVHSDEATFDIQFGNIARKVHTNTSWDKARFESCGQKWMDFSEGHYGVSLLNDCKYGHSVRNGVLSLSLIKSGNYPNPVADREEHVFTYALYPHAGGWRDGGTVREGYRLNQPMYALPGGTPGRSLSFAAVEAENVVLETVKRAEDGDGTILRLYEADNALTRTAVRLPEGTARAAVCDLLENVQEELPVRDGQVRVTLKPYEIVTLRVW